MRLRLFRLSLTIARSWILGMALATLAFSASPSLAVGPGGGPPGGGGGGGGGGTKGGGGSGGTVPEINPNAAAAALTILAGATLILTDRLRRRQTAEA